MSVPTSYPAASTALLMISRASLPPRSARSRLITHGGGEALLLQDLLEVVDLGAHAHGLGEARGTDRRDHELLHVDVVVGGYRR